jgi:hypothetical protein
MGVRKSLAALALAAAFGAGVLTSHAFEREAKAQKSATVSAVYVPSDGLAFRTLDGRLIAKLAYDTRGGFFEVYDEHEKLAGSLRGAGVSAARPAVAAAPATAPAPAPAANASNASNTLDLGY